MNDTIDFATDFFGELKESVAVNDPPPTKKLTPFDFIEDVSNTKKDLIRSSEDPVQTAKQYEPFIVNKGLSYFVDSILHVNEMNRLPDLPKMAQHQYFLNALRPRDRRSKWFKKEEDERLDTIQYFYSCNRTVAKHYLSILPPSDIDLLSEKRKNGQR